MNDYEEEPYVNPAVKAQRSAKNSSAIELSQKFNKNAFNSSLPREYKNARSKQELVQMS